MDQSSPICTNRQNIAGLYEEFRDMVCRYIAARIPHKYEAEDLTQDVFLRLLESAVIVEQNTAKSLLLTIARNLITDTLRRYYKKEDVMSVWDYEHSTSVSTAEDELILHEIESAYNASVETLPEKSRHIFYLMENDGLTASEIATMLSLSKRTIESHIYNARLKVRLAVTEYLMAG